MVIQKSDQDNTILILNKNDYILRLNRILDDISKIPPFWGKQSLKSCNSYKRAYFWFTQKIRNETSEKNYGNLYPSRSKPGILYWLGKIRKPMEEGIPIFRPIMSAIGTPTYLLERFCNNFMKPIATN